MEGASQVRPVIDWLELLVQLIVAGVIGVAIVAAHTAGAVSAADPTRCTVSRGRWSRDTGRQSADHRAPVHGITLSTGSPRVNGSAWPR